MQQEVFITLYNKNSLNKHFFCILNTQTGIWEISASETELPKLTTQYQENYSEIL